MPTSTSTGQPNIFDQLIGDDGVKFNVTFEMVDIIIIIAGIFAAVTFGGVVAHQINRVLDK